jgi:RHS repeat-associated protein
MNKAGLQYIQLVYFYRLLLVRYLVLFNLVSLLAENLPEDEPSLGENANMGEPPLEPADCFEKGRIGQQVTGKELDEETGLMYFGARYYDPKISSWISTDPALETDYLPKKEFFDIDDQKINKYAEEKYKLLNVTESQKSILEKEFVYDLSRYNEIKGLGGIYNSKNLNLFIYTHANPIIYNDPDGRLLIELLIAATAAVLTIWGGMELADSLTQSAAQSTKMGILGNDLMVLSAENKFTPEQNKALFDIGLKLTKGSFSNLGKEGLSKLISHYEDLAFEVTGDAGTIIKSMLEIVDTPEE